MGVCQSYFGASTSGQGFTASQLAACIRAAAHKSRSLPSALRDQKKKSDEEATTSSTAAAAEGGGEDSGNQNAAPASGSDGSSAASSSPASPLKDEAYTAHQTIDVESGGSKLNITSFAPGAFRQVRKMEGIDDEFFESEWELPEDHLGLRETEGRSRAMFLVSNHRCLLCKTVSEGEVNVLLGMLPSLMTHLTDHPESLLQRFVLALKITEEKTKENGWVVVFTDIFAKSPVIHEKWDLKGRQPKCAKYLFLPATDKMREDDDDGDDSDGKKDSSSSDGSSPTALQKKKREAAAAAAGEQQKDSTAETAERKSALSSVAAERSNPNVTADALDEDTYDRPVMKVYGDGYNRVIARKDKELTRVFWIPKGEHQNLHKTIELDVNFLGKAGILDYSVLIGVKYCDPGSPYKALRFNELYHPISNPDEIACERRDTCDGVKFESSSKYHRGIPSSASLEHYYIGIIDMLTAYTVPKKAANFFKNCLWSDATLSTIPPEMYQERCKNFMTKCIVEGPDA